MNDAVAPAHPLILIQSAPYAGSLARSAVDAALGLAVFNQSPALLFTGPGVRCLAPGQDPALIGRKSLARVIDSFPIYDIEEVHVDGTALAEHGMESSDLPAYATVLDATEVQQLCSAAAQILSF